MTTQDDEALALGPLDLYRLEWKHLEELGQDQVINYTHWLLGD